MSKIDDIIKSGRPPGAKCGPEKYDPNSVFAKVPRALAQIERGDGKAKRPIGAKEISKHFGMSVDFIKKQWSKPVPVMLMLSLCLSAFAGNDLTRGFTFVDGQRIDAAQLHALVDNATIQPSFITLKPISPGPFQSDLIVLASGGVLYKTTLGSIFNNSTIGPGISPYINVAALQFAYTNNIGIPTNFVLSPYSPTNPSLYDTNDPVQTLVWGTNGIPYQMSLSNLAITLLPAIETNSESFLQQFVFSPWTLGWTNGNSNGTNIFGLTTNFPITSVTLSNTQTLASSDTIPIKSTQQVTNTTVSLGALYNYFSNQNALPNYTQARVQFSGYPATLGVPNNAQTGLFSIIEATNTATTNTIFTSPNIYAVSMVTNGNTQPLWTGIQSNTVYYVIPTTTNNSWMTVYSSYTNALLGRPGNNLTINNAGAGTPCVMYYLTNYTSFNADPIQITGAGTVQNALYGVFFRTPAANSLYYLSGSAMNTPTGPGRYMGYSEFDIVTTTEIWIATFSSTGAGAVSPLVEALISPQ